MLVKYTSFGFRAFIRGWQGRNHVCSQRWARLEISHFLIFSLVEISILVYLKFQWFKKWQGKNVCSFPYLSPSILSFPPPLYDFPSFPLHFPFSLPLFSLSSFSLSLPFFLLSPSFQNFLPNFPLLVTPLEGGVFETLHTRTITTPKFLHQLVVIILPEIMKSRW